MLAPRYEDLRSAMTEGDYRSILESLGFDLKGQAPDRDGNIVHLRLPASLKGRPDSTPSCSVNVRDGLINDHGGDWRGDIFQAAEEAFGMSPEDARQWVADKIGGVATSEVARTPTPKREPVKAEIPPPREVSGAIPIKHAKGWSRALLDANHGPASRLREYLEVRGFTVDTMQKYLIGAREDRGRWWMFLPLTVHEGSVVRWKQTEFDPDLGGWKLKDGDKNTLQPKGGGTTLYPLAAFEKDPYPTLLCEGELDALLARQEGYNAVTGTGGAGTMKREWAAILAKKGLVVIAYDGDQAGQDGAERATKIIEEQGGAAYTLDLPKGEDVGSLILQDAWDMLYTTVPDDEADEEVAPQPGRLAPPDEYHGFSDEYHPAPDEYPSGDGQQGPAPSAGPSAPSKLVEAREMEVVACAVQHPGLIPALREALPAGDVFANPRLGILYRRVLEAYDSAESSDAIDIALLRHRLGEEQADQLAFYPLDSGYERTGQAVKQAEKVREAHDKRRLAAALEHEAQRLRTSTDPIDDDRASVYRAVAETGIHLGSRSQHIRVHTDEVKKRVEQWKVGERVEYETTGFLGVDRRLIGYRRGKLHVFGADSGSGKSSWILGSAAGVAAKYARKEEFDKVILLFSIEMDGPEVAERAAAQVSRIDTRRLKEGTASEDEYRRFVEALDQVARLTIVVNTHPAPTLEYIHSEIVRFSCEGEVVYVGVDYIEQVESSGGGNDQENVAHISSGLRQIADETYVPLIALSQLNENHLQKGPTYAPTYSSLRSSRKVVHDAYSICFWHWPMHLLESHGVTAQSEDGLPSRLALDTTRPERGAVLIKKGRDGGSGGLVPFSFWKEHTHFEDEEESNLVDAYPDEQLPRSDRAYVPGGDDPPF